MAISEQAVLALANLTSTGLAGLTLTQLNDLVFLSRLPTTLQKYHMSLISHISKVNCVCVYKNKMSKILNNFEKKKVRNVTGPK